MRHFNLFASIIGVIVLSAASASAHTSTKTFVHDASIANEFEIESSQLALDKSQNSDIKAFAQRMVDDHTKTGDKLKEALKSSGDKEQPAESLDDTHRQLLDKLKAASGADFDRQYIAIQTQAHKEAVHLFSDYAKSGKDAALKKFASDTLPTLKDHLKHVKELKASE